MKARIQIHKRNGTAKPPPPLQLSAEQTARSIDWHENQIGEQFEAIEKQSGKISRALMALDRAMMIVSGHWTGRTAINALKDGKGKPCKR